MPTTYNILILGASYGSLLGTKLALAGHNVHPVCLPAEADLINSEGAIVRLPVKGRDGLVEVNSKRLPGQMSAGGTTAFNPADHDLVALAMQEPQYRSPGVRELLEAVAKALAVPDAKPIEEAKVETLPEEPKPAAQPEPAEVAASTASEAEPGAEKARETPKVTEATAEPASPEPEPAPVAKASPREEKAAPKSTRAEKSRETAAAKAQGGLFGKPMALGFGRKTAPAAGRVSSGRYAANVRAAIGRHRPRVGGGGSATVAFSIGPGGGLQGVKIVRSSGRQAADQAAVATVRAAAPFPPPPAGINNTFSIQIYFR